MHLRLVVGPFVLAMDVSLWSRVENLRAVWYVKTGMSVWAKHALVVLAVMLSLGNAKCFASCSPEIVAAGSRFSESGKPVSGDCHKHSSNQREGHQNRDSHGEKPHSCLHDALLTAATDTYNTSSVSTSGFPVVEGFFASPASFVPARRPHVSDLSPPFRLHPNLTIVIRV